MHGIKLYLKEIELKVVEWINLEIMDRDNWWAVVNSIMNIGVP